MSIPNHIETPDYVPDEGMHVVDVMTASTPFIWHDHATSPVQTAIGGADRQYVVFSMEPDDVVFAEMGSFHSAAVKPVLSVSVVGSGRGEWIETMPIGIQWLARLITPPFRVIGALIGRTAAGESALMLTVRAAQRGTAIFVNHSGGQIQRIPLSGGETMTARRGAWVAHTGDISLGVGTMHAPVTAFASGAPFWYERATGEGDVFVAAGGHIVRRVIPEGDRLVVKPDHLLGWLGSPVFGVASIGSIGGALWAKEGVVLLAIEGPSVVYLDTAPRVSRGKGVTPDTRYTGRAQ
ncbi:MAG: AIM24 family protein [Gemmatimonadaceae bacterium]